MFYNVLGLGILTDAASQTWSYWVFQTVLIYDTELQICYSDTSENTNICQHIWTFQVCH